jgi:hypothetical protein
MNVVNFFNNELSQAVGSELVNLPTITTISMELSRGAPLRSGWVAEGPDFRYPTSFAQSTDADVGQGEMGLPFVHVLALKSGGGLQELSIFSDPQIALFRRVLPGGRS